LFTLADLYEKQLNNPEEAKKFYQRLMNEYPGSMFNAEARKRFRNIRGDGLGTMSRRVKRLLSCFANRQTLSYLCTMLLYNVTLIIEEDIAAEWLKWMKEIHIPEVMETGKFVSNRLLKVLDSPNEGVTYCAQYVAETQGGI
jgi:hypothetical protein